MTDPDLNRLVELAGIETSYRDAWGDVRRVPPEGLHAVLSALGFAVDTRAGIREAVERLEARRWRRLPPVRVIRATESAIHIPVVVSADERDSGRRNWVLTEENGASHHGVFVPADARLLETETLAGRLLQRRALELAVPVPLGYHRFRFLAPGETEQTEAETVLVIAPEQCDLPESLRRGGRSWGLAVQLYSLRSQGNWGVGDFGDLGALVRESARFGADVVGVNPLHALFPTAPERASPYAPSSRLFVNPVYLDVEAIPDFRDCGPARELTTSSRFREEREALCESDFVDYTGVTACKLQILEHLYEFFRARHLVPGQETERGREFRAFQAEGGEALRLHAVYETLAETYSVERKPTTPWRTWPPEYRRPGSPEVDAFAREHEHRVEFHQYLQWQADLQLGAASRLGERAGLGIGIFRDLAVGAAADGSEAWASTDARLENVEAGAPPDAWNLKGQRWGFPPPNPFALEDAAYAPFRDLLRANMRHAGALRIDHVMGLRRLFCVPEGYPAAAGTYLRYPLDDLLGILALESRRQQCMVVGEDLGTVPDGMRNALETAGVISCRVLYFERDDKDDFVRPKDYPVQALVAATTHDLPTVAGFWTGHDLEMKRALDWYRSPEEEREAPEARSRDKQRLLNALVREGLLSEAEEDAAWFRIVEAVYAYLAETPSMLLMVNLEDVLGQEDQINVPGTADAEPNWRRRATEAIGALSRNPVLLEVVARIRERRGADHQDGEG